MAQITQIYQFLSSGFQYCADVEYKLPDEMGKEFIAQKSRFFDFALLPVTLAPTADFIDKYFKFIDGVIEGEHDYVQDEFPEFKPLADENPDTWFLYVKDDVITLLFPFLEKSHIFNIRDIETVDYTSAYRTIDACMNMIKILEIIGDKFFPLLQDASDKALEDMYSHIEKSIPIDPLIECEDTLTKSTQLEVLKEFALNE